MGIETCSKIFQFSAFVFAFRILQSLYYEVIKSVRLIKKLSTRKGFICYDFIKVFRMYRKGIKSDYSAHLHGYFINTGFTVAINLMVTFLIIEISF